MSPWAWYVAGAGALVVLLLIRASVRYIPHDRIGIVEKRFSRKGSVRGGLIALHGEAGFQPGILRGGLHWMMPLQWRVHVMPLVTIPQGEIGYVFARDGAPMGPTQTLASNELADDFADVAEFLRVGGQRGPQRKILREGTYAIHLAEFVVITAQRVYQLPLAKDDIAIFQRMAATIAERDGFRPIVIRGTDDRIGVVTVHDGPSLPQSEIIAPIVGDDPRIADKYHNDFQDPEHFLAAGGFRGRQLQVLKEGTYHVNRLFATVELVPKTVVDVGWVGVVVSYTGQRSRDLSGADYKHGELVEPGCRGVWSEALLPGKYAFNTFAGKVVPVPTTNFILKWSARESGAHKYDENLAEVSLITKDAFEPRLPLSVVVHIDYKKAPLVVQRFGDVKRLVEQTLDPMVAAYFKNIGQTRTLIELIHDRADIQKIASAEMQEKFAHYNLELEEVLIGTPVAADDDEGHIEQILEQLRSRQIAEEQVETYARCRKAAVEERQLREAQAIARKQQELTESELAVAIQANAGKADYERSLQDAARMRVLADAEAEKTARLGAAQAVAIEEQVRAYGGPRFQLTQQVMNRFAEAIEKSGVALVPRVVVGGATSGANGAGAQGSPVNGLVEGLLALLLAQQSQDEDGAEPKPANGQARSPELRALRERVGLT